MKETSEIKDFTSTTVMEDNSACIVFSTGNKLIVDKAGGELKLLDGNDMLQLVVLITDKGLVVDMKASQLNIQADEQINLSSKKINLKATELISISSAGNLVQQVDKDHLSETGGMNKNIAEQHKITATLGNVELKANDDIRFNGERVLLNCD